MEPDDSLDPLRRLRVPPVLIRHGPKQMERFDMPRLRSQDLPEFLLRLMQTSGLVILHGPVKGLLGIQSGHGVVRWKCPNTTIALRLHHAKLSQRVAKWRFLSQTSPPRASSKKPVEP